MWLPADTTDTMQSFSSTRCTAMNTGEYLALRDERDNDTYEAPLSQDSNTLCNTDSSACIDQVLFNANDINRSSS